MKLIFKFNFILIALLLILLTPALSNAATYYVNDDTGNDGWGGSAESPFATIQAAVDATSASGDEIRVAEGTYTGTSEVDPGSLGESYYQVVFILNKSLILKGGYDTSDWTTSNPKTNITTIDAQDYGRCITIKGSGSQNVTVDGFTLTGGDYTGLGNADGVSTSECRRTGSDCGGGLYAKQVLLNLTNCVVTGNIAGTTGAYSDGGGIYLYQAADGTHIENLTVSGNYSLGNYANGGGLLINEGNGVSISQCTFSNNHADSMGSGMCIWQPEGIISIEDTIFSGNTGYSTSRAAGGGFYASLVHTGETDLYVNRATFNDNQAGSGACIYIYRQGGGDISYTSLNNLVLYGNTPYFTGTNGSLLHVQASTNYDFVANHLTASNNSAQTFLYVDDPDSTGETSTVTINNTIIDSFTNAFAGDQNSLGAILINYNNVLVNNATNLETTVYGNPTFNAGESIFGDPKLDATYHLTKGSPAIDAGIDVGTTTDIDGDARPQGSGYDIGADEFIPSANVNAGMLLMLLN